MRILPFSFAATASLFIGSALSTHAALIASDSFLIGGGSNYNATNLSSQTATGGTTGYASGSAWTYNTSAVQANATALSHSYVVNPPSANNGGLYLPGVGASNGIRSQIRQLTAYSTTETNYYFSGLMSSSTVFTTGTALFGLSGVTGSASLPTVGLQVGFTSGGLISLFYRNAGGTYTNSAILSGYTAGETYMFVVHLAAASGLVDVSLYNSAGIIVGSLTGIQTTTSVANDLTRVNASVTGDFNAGSPSQIRFDEFRFGTELADVIIPEPAVALLSGFGALVLLRRRR